MTWDKSGPPGTAIQFLDAVRGWLRDGKLLRTADGGKTWESVENDGKSCFAAMVFYFLDDYHGWYVSSQTEESIEGGAQTGYVVATSDGGKTCVKLSRIPGQNLWSVFFLNEREGWVGGIGSLFKTEDGGHTWTKISAE
jgi:photosystem II stability/assembly factor-like uncharacterized protein